MRKYNYCFIANAWADTRSHKVTWQDNYVATLNLLNLPYNMQRKFCWNK